MPSRQIVPLLVVGDAASREERHSFDVVVDLTKGLQGVHPTREWTGNFQLEPAPLLSNDDYEQWLLFEFFARPVEWIEGNRCRGKKVLVHCSEDIQKSYALVVAYLDVWRNTPRIDEAISYIVQRNPHAFQSSTFRKFRPALEYCTQSACSVIHKSNILLKLECKEWS